MTVQELSMYIICTWCRETDVATDFRVAAYSPEEAMGLVKAGHSDILKDGYHSNDTTADKLTQKPTVDTPQIVDVDEYYPDPS